MSKEFRAMSFNDYDNEEPNNMAKTQGVKIKDLKGEELVKFKKEFDDLVGTVVAARSGSNSKEFGTMIFDQLSACYPKMDTIALLANILDGMGGIKPKDHVEGMLAAQMLATHNAAMNSFKLAASYLGSAQIPTAEIGNAILNSANKLIRSYTMQMEALNRYRGKGQQKMTVEHVHINSGGQAIIGNVTSAKEVAPEYGGSKGENLKNKE